ncbi:thioredoxin domain-containing protein [Nocardioides mesophilus]|uniref:Thioredoxin domain-containing protein n=1 Tax=Nocardioides mesophilus TaxID=433659 RepID=A0A7G9R7T1_9ACTN|nr:thioredoxin domain-containing protein [Nocardioides mesophilus]QNN51656.1 thioredoxin domain-containing protein [Nocardioides mesophilus]
MANRLAGATSPYLLQHQDNPVDWWEWSEAAFAEARSSDRPVLLSVGYAACHWCHVMAHESFEDETTAAFMNSHFVNIKVDREERPDVDAVYMQATTAMTGHGGWPMTVVLTPAGEPFFAGTYFPDQPRHGQPAFRQVLESLAAAWRERRDEVGTVARDVAEHLRGQAMPAGEAPIDEEVLAGAVRALAGDYDAQHAGFGIAPKFPPSMVLEFLLRHAARTGSAQAANLASATLTAMARGGIYDQLGGGFARYSVDRGWVVPHFEKMLYDNAQLLGVYARWWRQGGDPLAERVARETADFLIAELGTAQGGFASALDADSEGVEGKFYAWSPAELVEVLGEDDGAWAADLLTVTEAGTFEHGTSTLQLLRDPDDPGRWESIRARLLRARADRVRPARDDKVVAAWNGLAISSLAQAGALLDEPRYVDAAVAAGRLLVDLHLDGPALLRVSRDGVAGRHTGVLEDYACVADGFLALSSVTGDGEWATRAGSLLDQALTRFAADDGGFYDTAVDAEALVARPRDPSDNASPSGQSALVHALLGWAALTGSGRHRDAAEAALRQVRVLAERVPRFAGWSLAAAEAALAGPVEVAVVGDADDPARAELERTARRTTSPGAVVAVGAPGSPGGPAAAVPLLADRPLVDGHAAAYVCRGMVCDRPVTTVEELAGLLAAR